MHGMHHRQRMIARSFIPFGISTAVASCAQRCVIRTSHRTVAFQLIHPTARTAHSQPSCSSSPNTRTRTRPRTRTATMSATIAPAPPSTATQVASALYSDEFRSKVLERGPAAGCNSLLSYACAVLNEADAWHKAELTAEADALFHAGRIPLHVNGEAVPRPPDTPARPAMDVRAPADMPQALKGVQHHNANKIRLIHSLAHIESYAIDLSWDILVRFATVNPSSSAASSSSSSTASSDSTSSDSTDGVGLPSTEGVVMPQDFYVDWLRIASEEARHFMIWTHRLKELDSYYGALPVHDGLWQSASQTSDSLLARLAVVHAVHEAMGLDRAGKMKQQLVTWRDEASRDLLDLIELDELTHVASGLRWFKHICASTQPTRDPIETFHSVVRANFRGKIKAPFDVESRSKAGFTPEWYMPLSNLAETWKPNAKEEKTNMSQSAEPSNAQS